MAIRRGFDRNRWSQWQKLLSLLLVAFHSENAYERSGQMHPNRAQLEPHL